MRRTALTSWNHLQRIELEKLQRFELPIARFQSLFANANRGSNTEPFKAEEFLVFKRASDTPAGIPAAASASLLSLRADNRVHPLLLSCWGEVLAAASEHTALPEIRALVSADEQVWVIAPAWEGSAVRGLVCVGDFIHGRIRLRDIDRRLMIYDLILPKRPNAAAGWVESGHLLMPAT